MVGCLVLAAALRVWRLWSNGLGNSYYTAAAVSMSKNWTAFLAGSLDSSNFITVDKPAPWLWPSAILIKLFGLNWATELLPNAVAGVLTVLVLGVAVREAAGDTTVARVAALLAAGGLAIYPINVAIDRVNDPDPFLILVSVLAAWMLLRAVGRSSWGYLLGSAALIGLAFDMKDLEGYVVLPALGVAWLVCGAGSVLRRLGGLVVAGVTVLVATAIWPIAVQSIPAAQRPWIGGSTDGTILNLALGYNGLGRVLGRNAPGNTAGGVNIGNLPPQAREMAGRFMGGGSAGPTRLVSQQLADQVSWWLPLAVLGAVAIGLSLRGRKRTDPAVAALVLWSGWILVCATLFSFMQGIFHGYYTALLSPGLVALSGWGAVAAWTSWRRGSRLSGLLLAGEVLVGAGWAVWVLLKDVTVRPAWLVPAVLIAGVLALLGVAVGSLLRAARIPVLVGSTAVAVAVAVAAAPLTWSALTTMKSSGGGGPTANPGASGGGGGGFAVFAGGTPRNRGGQAPAAGAGGRGGFGMGEASANPKLVAYLRSNRGGARWIVATTSAMQAAPLIIASGGEPVMAMGGFSGSDPTPTLDRFKAMVRDGEVRYVLTGGGRDGFVEAIAGSAPPAGGNAATPGGTAAPPGGGGRGGFGGTASQVTAWAQQACKPVDPASYGGSTQQANPGQLGNPGQLSNLDPSQLAELAQLAGANQKLFDCGGAA